LDRDLESILREEEAIEGKAGIEGATEVEVGERREEVKLEEAGLEPVGLELIRGSSGVSEEGA